jgi:hypothetical protein
MSLARRTSKNIRLTISVVSRRGIKARGIRVFLLADETAPPLQFLCPFIPAASGRGILDELVKFIRYSKNARFREADVSAYEDLINKQ